MITQQPPTEEQQLESLTSLTYFLCGIFHAMRNDSVPAVANKIKEPIREHISHLTQKLMDAEKEKSELAFSVKSLSDSILVYEADEAKLKQQLAAALARIEQFETASKSLLKDDSSWPLDAVAETLVESVHILLVEKGYDGYLRERFAIARNHATLIPNAVKFLREAISKSTSPADFIVLDRKLAEAVNNLLQSEVTFRRHSDIWKIFDGYGLAQQFKNQVEPKEKS